MTSVWMRVLGVALVAVLGLASCGDDPDPIRDGDAGAEQDDAGTEQDDAGTDEDVIVSLYCELVADLDEAGREFFKEIEKDDDATRKDYEKAERDFFREHDSDLDEMLEAGPDEIADDLRTLVASIRDRAGLGPNVPQREASAAEKRIQRFEKQSC